MTLRSFLGRATSPLGCFAVMAFLASGPVGAHMPTSQTGTGTIYDAGFDFFMTGGSLPADSSGESSDRPSSIDRNLTATVENGTTIPSGTPTLNGTKFVRLKEACGEAPNLAFDNGAAIFTGIAHVAVDVLFESFESYQIIFRNGSGSGIAGPASQTIADIDIIGTNMRFSSAGGTTAISYEIGQPYHIDAFFDLDANKWYAFINGGVFVNHRVVNGAAILDSPLGFVGIGFNFSSFCPDAPGASFAGIMQFDNFVFQQVTAVPVVTPPADGPTISTAVSGLHYPQGVAVRDGVLYIADRSGHTVWKKVLATGEISPVAGTGLVQVNNGVTTLVTGRQGYNGDGISATQARLNGPAGVAVDANGNVFVTDSGNHIVRKINTGGMITTVAGTPKTLPPVVNGQLALGNGGPATLAFLNGPRGISVDAAGNIFIVDTMNQQVRKVDASGAISAVAGVAGLTGASDGSVSCAPTNPDCVQARLNDPRGIAVDAAGNVYIGDVGNNKIRKVAGGSVTSVAAGTLRAPAGVAVGTDGTLYIADTTNHRVRRLADGEVTTVAGGEASPLNTPVGVAVDANGDVYIADQVNNRVVRVSE